MKRLVLAAVAAFALLPASASAQFDGPAYAFPVPDYVSGLIAYNNLSLGQQQVTRTGGKTTTKRKAKPRKRKPKPAPKATAKQLRTLRFTRDPALSEKTLGAAISQVQEPGVDPAMYRQPILDGLARFREVVERAQGGSPLDLGDTVTMTLLQSYARFHRIDDIDKRGIAKVRTAVRHSMARERSVRVLPNERKQEVAEVLELKVLLFIDGITVAEATGDSTDKYLARSDMRLFAKDLTGIDVSRVKITKRGLEPR